MGDIILLNGSDRDFFRLVYRLTFSNPFETETSELIHTIAGGDYQSRDALNHRMREVIQQRLESALLSKGLSWKKFTGEDQELVRVALLYSTYESCLIEFDDLILNQIQHGEDLCDVPFAGRILSLLNDREFPPDQSLQYLSFYYQLRRAWYFISQGLIGQNPSMEKLRSHLWRSVFTYDAHWYEQFLWNRMEDFSTLLVGETGTGKGTAAAAVGRSGYIPFDEKKNHFAESFMRNFIEINLSQFPESLIESELFGHRKGAFTGAIDSHKGVFALCSQYGSIFLDEIGDVTIPVQIKLLKVLEERNFTPVGSHEKSLFSGRIIAATNKSINTLRKGDAFRQDFYYRLCSNVITVPTLRDQIREEPATRKNLLKHTIRRIIGQPSSELEGIVLDVIDKEIGSNYHWPGNVRELEQAVRCVLLNRDYCSEIEGWCAVQTSPLTNTLQSVEVSAQELLSAYCAILYRKHKTFGDVAKITGLDSRTVKKYIQMQSQQ